MTEAERRRLAELSADNLIRMAEVLYGDDWPRIVPYAMEFFRDSANSSHGSTAKDFFAACDLAKQCVLL